MIRRRIVIGLLLMGACRTQALPPAGLDTDQGTIEIIVPEVFTAEEGVFLVDMTLRDATTPPDPSNRFADDDLARELGRQFFFDTGFSGKLLSADNNLIGGTLAPQGTRSVVSCASCHVAEDGFVDTRTFEKRISLASDWVLRKTPTLLDVAQVRLLMWDGRHSTLFGQAVAPVEAAEEFNSSRLFLAQEIKRRYQAPYEAIFGPMGDLGPDFDPELTGCTVESFGRPFDDRPPSERGCHGVPGDEAEYDALSAEQKAAVDAVAAGFGKAVAAYQRVLSCGPSRFDAFMLGDSTALNEQEIQGAKLFVGKGDCVRCHSGPYLSDQDFHNVGLEPARVTNFLIDDDDPGASVGLARVGQEPFGIASPHSDAPEIAASVLPADPENPAYLGRFKTPMLRCLKDRPSFMHTAQLRSIKGVVDFFNRGGDSPRGFLGTKEIAPLGLSKDEVAALVALLEALQGPGPDAHWLSGHAR